jgi:Flp pilus assembly protein TadG
MTSVRQGWISRLYVGRCRIFNELRGAALVEFAIAANLLIVINILTFDFANYYRLSEQVKHATQFIQTVLANDRDHKLTVASLEQQRLYISAVTGNADFNSTGTLIAIDAMPLYSPASKQWSLIVCWSWSSNPNVKAPPAIGSQLSSAEYPVAPWISPAATIANSALLIVETHFKNIRFFTTSLIPDMSTQHMIGPIRYAANLPINLMLYDVDGGRLLNNSTVQELTGAKSILCRR